MEKILTEKEREKLIQHHRKERDGRIRDRIKAVLAYDDGYISNCWATSRWAPSPSSQAKTAFLLKSNEVLASLLRTKSLF